jgi:UDP-N-acetylmuramoylalanine--D-glutamate ligase
MNEYQGKTAAVIGLARAGVPAAKFLVERGALVIGFDGKARDQLSEEALELEALGVELQLGDHGFVGIENCDLVVLSPGLKVHYEPLLSVIAAAEARGAEVIGELELAYRFCPCPIIAITGTKGKSTTTKLVTEMLRACGVDAIAAGNTGTPLISVLPTLKPESWVVVEVSSFQLEKAPTFQPKIAVLLSLLEDHQDYHPDLEQYWETKLKLFANQGPEDWAVFNIDEPRVLKAMLEHEEWCGAPTSCRTPEAFPEIRWSSGPTDGEGKYFPLVYGNEEGTDLYIFAPPAQPGVSVEKFPLRGRHNISNLAAALGVVVLSGVKFGPTFDKIKIEAIQATLAALQSVIDNFQTLPHRLEIVAQKDGITWVNDSQSTIPDATIAALRSFPSPVTLLVGGRAKIEASAYEVMMRAIHVEDARLVLFGEAAEMLREVALAQGMEKSKIFRENTLAEAVQVAKMKALNGESVILSPACASFDQFTSYEHRGETFRQLVREI